MRVLFLGEGSLGNGARYLAAVLSASGIRFDHCWDREPIPASFLKRHYDAFILSDYRHESFSHQRESWLCDQVRQGTGLLMIGGWASFTGLVGGYSGTRIESLLPVRCLRGDDRVNWASGSVAVKRREHSLLDGLDWRDLPVVCGYHRVVVKPGAKTLLELRELRFRSGRPAFGPSHPLLVAGSMNGARTAAFMTDCAPHWCGGLVDWGKRRVVLKAAPGISVEVGDQYLRFFSQLVQWVCRFFIE